MDKHSISDDKLGLVRLTMRYQQHVARIARRGWVRYRRAVCLCVVVTTGWTCAGFAAQDSTMLQPYEVSYRGKRAGLSADTVTALLYDSASGDWILKTIGRARGLASVFVDSVPTEITRFNVNNVNIRPLMYSAEDGTEDSDKDTTVTFDWSARTVRVQQGAESTEHELADGTMSPLTADIAMRMALMGGAENVSFTVVEGLKVRQYQYSPMGEGGAHKTPIGTFNTIKYRLQRSGSQRELHLWLAPDLDYLPVYMEQIHNGKRKYRFEIRSLSRH